MALLLSSFEHIYRLLEHDIFTGQMYFLAHNQHCQRTDRIHINTQMLNNSWRKLNI